MWDEFRLLPRLTVFEIPATSLIYKCFTYESLFLKDLVEVLPLSL